MFEWNGAVHCFVIKVGFQMVGALGTLVFNDGHWVAETEVGVLGGIGPFAEYTDGSLMIFTRDGILRIRAGRDGPWMKPVVSAPYAGSFISNPIQADSMAITDDGIIYVGARGGVVRVYPSPRGWGVDWLQPAFRGE